jgi:hypothetical protein
MTVWNWKSEGRKLIIENNGIKEKPGWVATGLLYVIISIGLIGSI